jgi:membrane protein XagC
MRRALAAAPVATLSFVMVLALAAIAVRGGLIGDDALRLWAGASTAADGQVPIGRIVAAYPTLPFLASTLVAWISPAGTPAPALVAAVLLATIAAFCFRSFCRIGLPEVTAAVFSALIALHPAMVHAAVAGPADMFLAAFMLMFCLALYNLRARSGTSEVMGVGLVLMALAFSHPIGATLAFAAVLFLGFAVRPLLVANSALNVVVAMIFPTAFAIAAFSYVSWIFPGDGWTFFAAPTQSLSVWSVAESSLFGDGFARLLPFNAAAAIAAAVVLGAPVAVVMLGRVYRRRPLIIPAVVFIAAVLAASAISVASGFFGAPAALVVAGPVLAAVVVMRVPFAPERRNLVTGLLLLGWFGGFVSVALVDPAMVIGLRAAVERGDTVNIDALTAGGATRHSDGVLADVENAPAFVLGRGRADGVLGPQSEPFALALLFDRIDAPFVAVPDPQSSIGAGDQIDKAFPALFRDGLPGYRVIYQNNTWRLFARIRDTVNSKD